MGRSVYTCMVWLGSDQQQFQVKLCVRWQTGRNLFISCVCSPDCLMICEWCFPLGSLLHCVYACMWVSNMPFVDHTCFLVLWLVYSEVSFPVLRCQHRSQAGKNVSRHYFGVGMCQTLVCSACFLSWLVFSKCKLTQKSSVLGKRQLGRRGISVWTLKQWLIYNLSLIHHFISISCTPCHSCNYPISQSYSSSSSNI